MVPSKANNLESWEKNFNDRNHNRDETEEIDLHGLTRSQAQKALKKKLPHSLARGEAFKIITGRGIHSDPAIGPVLPEYVKRYLSKKNSPTNYHFHETSKGGALLLRKGKPLKNSKNKVNITHAYQLKYSEIKALRTELQALYPQLQFCIKDILPKKGNIKKILCSSKRIIGEIELVVSDTTEGLILFVKPKHEPYYPTLRLIHKYPFILPEHRVNDSAIRSILKGSNVFCANLTSIGACVTPELEKGTVVAIMAEGKEHALCIGMMTMSSAHISQSKKDIGVESRQYLNDFLWKATIGTIRVLEKRKRTQFASLKKYSKLMDKIEESNEEQCHLFTVAGNKRKRNRKYRKKRKGKTNKVKELPVDKPRALKLEKSSNSKIVKSSTSKINKPPTSNVSNSANGNQKRKNGKEQTTSQTNEPLSFTVDKPRALKFEKSSNSKIVKSSTSKISKSPISNVNNSLNSNRTTSQANEPSSFTEDIPQALIVDNSSKSKTNKSSTSKVNNPSISNVKKRTILSFSEPSQKNIDAKNSSVVSSNNFSGINKCIQLQNERRKHEIIVYGVPEWDFASDRKFLLLKLIDNENVGYNFCPDNVSHYRLGVKQVDKLRPIKLILSSESAVDTLLRHWTTLKKPHFFDMFGKKFSVSLRKSLCKAERDAQANLRNELTAKKRANIAVLKDISRRNLKAEIG